MCIRDRAKWDRLDFLIHSLAYADQQDLQIPFSSTSREGFSKAHLISAYSLMPLTHQLLPLMRESDGASILSISFIGSVLAVPNYNVMGPAKAALESSVRYLARELGPEISAQMSFLQEPSGRFRHLGLKIFLKC